MHRIVLLFCSVILLLASQAGLQYAMPASESSEFLVTVSGPSFSSLDGKSLSGAVKDQQVKLKFSLDGSASHDFIVILEIRDHDGVGMNLQVKGGSLEPGKSEDIFFSWTSEHTGDYKARVLVLSSFESPEMLSEISESTIKVVKSESELAPPIVAPPVTVIEPTPLPAGPAGYTVLVYMVASDLESGGYYATQDIVEMMTVGSTENVNVIIQTGGSANSTIDDYRFIDFTKVQRHIVLRDNVELIQDLGERNMATAATLKEFVGWGIGKYPADKYAIILWDHGAGLIGFGFDNIHDDVLDLDELSEGLAPAKNSGKKFEVIAFDGCLMASIEVAGSLSQRGNYLVASEDLEPAWGLDYSAILSSLDENRAQSGEELGKKISDSYIEHIRANAEQYQDYSTDRTLTMSVIDLKEIPELLDNVGRLGDHFDRFGGDLEITHALTRSIHDTERYGEGGKSSAGHLDLYHLADNIDKQFPEFAGIGSEIKSGIDKAVVYRVSGDARPDSHGISIFMQVEEYEANAPYLRYVVGKWISVLTFARKTLEADDFAPTVSLSMRNDGMITGKIADKDVSYVSTFVTQDVEGNRLRLKILSIVDEEPSDFIKPDRLGFISYNWTREIMSLCNADQTGCVPTSITFEKNGNTKFAFLPARLESDRFNGTLILIYVVDPESGEFDFIGGWPGIDENGNAIRELVPLVEGDRVYSSTYLLRYDPVADETHFDSVEESTPIIVEKGFGPSYHRFAGEYELVISACDFSGNCGYSPEFHFNVD